MDGFRQRFLQVLSRISGQSGQGKVRHEMIAQGNSGKRYIPIPRPDKELHTGSEAPLTAGDTDLCRRVFGAAPGNQQQRSPRKTEKNNNHFNHGGKIQKPPKKSKPQKLYSVLCIPETPSVLLRSFAGYPLNQAVSSVLIQEKARTRPACSFPLGRGTLHSIVPPLAPAPYQSALCIFTSPVSIFILCLFPI